MTSFRCRRFTRRSLESAVRLDTASLLPQRDVRTGISDLRRFLSGGGVSPRVFSSFRLHVRRLASRFRGCRPGPLTPGACEILIDFDYDLT